MNNTTKYYSLIIAVVVLFAMMTVSCEKSPVDKGTDETDRMIDIRTSIEALTKSPALDGNGEGNFSNGDIFTLVVSGSGFPNIDTSYTVGTTDLSWADLNLPEDAGNVYFSGCYPVQGKAVDRLLSCPGDGSGRNIDIYRLPGGRNRPVAGRGGAGRERLRRCSESGLQARSAQTCGKVCVRKPTCCWPRRCKSGKTQKMQ